MPPRTGGQKRGAPENAEASGSAPHTAKKTRFVDPSEDPANFAEQVESALEDGSTKRKGRVKNEGYDSDSSDDGEGVVESRKKKLEDEDEDDDMFAMGEKVDKPDPESAKKKKDEFLRLGDIEGQEFGDGSDSDDSKEPEDEDDAERQKKVGMGFELSGFNMREEMEEGKFSSDGSYIRTFDPHGVHDRWMEGVDDKAIKAARKRKRQQEKQQREKQQAEDDDLEANGGKVSLEQDLLARLKKGETVLDALQRLGAQANKARKPLKGTAKRKTDSDSMSVDSLTKPIPEAAAKAPSDIDQITHLASTLMALGETEIYSKTYEELVRSVRSSGRVDATWEPPSAETKYEYKWDLPEAEGQPGAVFGPFGEVDLNGWYKASFFGAMGEKVLLRKIGGDWGFWDDIME